MCFISGSNEIDIEFFLFFFILYYLFYLYINIYNHIQKSKIKPKLKQLTDYINVENAKIEEQNYIFDYKKNGWKILNKAKAGAIGGNIIKWTYEKCKNEALKYNNRTEYFKNSTSYYAASRNGWLKEICSHMKKYEKI